MDNANADAIEIHNLVVLVVHFRSTAQELRTRWAQVRATARSRVVAATGGGWPRMKVLGFGKWLAYETRSHDFTVHCLQAAVRLFGKNKLGYTCHDGGIHQPRE